MRLILFIAVQVVATSSLCSQSIFPSLSPRGTIEQKVGLTDVIVEYERPSTRGRKVFGELVLYNKLWKTGAGNCTKISFSNAVLINQKRIEKGVYSVYTIPRENHWTVILNADTTGLYDKKNDVIDFMVKVNLTERHHESLTIDFDVILNNVRVYISWENTQVSFLIVTETAKMVDAYVEANLLTNHSKVSNEYAEAAEYYFYLNERLDRAIFLVDKAIDGENQSWYYRLKVDILEKQRKYKEAIDVANLAISVDNKRTEWDSNSKQQSESEYRRRIDFFKSKLKADSKFPSPQQ